MAYGTDPADARGDARHLVKGMTLSELLETTHLGDVKFGVGDVSLIVKLDRDLGVSFDAAHGFDGDALHGTFLIRISLSCWNRASCCRADR